MNRTQTLQHQSAFRQYAKLDNWHSPHAVTLTMKQCVTVDNAAASVRLILTPEEARQNFRHFINVLSAAVYGPAAKRHGKRLRVIPVIEGGFGKRLHYHAVIDCPRDDLIPTFPSLIRSTWVATQWGYGEIDITPQADSGWVNYISKTSDKLSYSDSIDWTNYHNPDCRV